MQTYKQYVSGWGTIRIANISPLVGSGSEWREFEGPGRKIKLPIASEKAPWAEVPEREAIFLLDRYGGYVPRRGDMGLRPIPPDETDTKLITVPLDRKDGVQPVALSWAIMEIGAGRRKTRVTPRDVRPWMGDQESDNPLPALPDDSWSERDVEKFIEVNGLQASVPAGAGAKERVRTVRGAARALYDRGLPIKPVLPGTTPQNAGA